MENKKFVSPEKRERLRRNQRNYLQRLKERREAQEKLIAHLEKSRMFRRIMTAIFGVLFIVALCF